MKHILYIMYSAACSATLLLCLLLTVGACSRESAEGTDPDALPADGQLTIGQLTIAATQSATPSAPAPASRIASGATGWESGDLIRVTATSKSGATLTGYYLYKENGTWEQTKLGSTATPAETFPLYIDDIDRTRPICIDTWGGKLNDPAEGDITGYTNQNDAPADGAAASTRGSRYYPNDHLRCPAATLHTAADAAAGIARGSLTGTLTHQRVDVVVRVLTDAAHPLPAATSALRLALPAANSTGQADATLRCWYAGHTPATADGAKAYATFRAYVQLGDVPGAGAVQTDATGSYINVADASVLGSLAYATTVADGNDGTTVSLPGSGTIALRYSVQHAAGQFAATVRPGTRVVVTVDFTSLQNPVLSATIEPWTPTEEGEVGTEIK